MVKAAVEKVTIGEPQANTKKNMFTTKDAKDTKGMSNINSENFVLSFENTCAWMINRMKNPNTLSNRRVPSYPPFDVAQDKLQRVSRLIGVENKPGFPPARE